jgi:hypothetical protein
LEVTDLKVLHDQGGFQHPVQFYRTEVFLLDLLTSYFREGLDNGEACIIIATKDHRDLLEERLVAAGVDLNAARPSGSYIALDAAGTLSHFMVNDMPDQARFSEVVGGLVAQAGIGGRRVRAFGEMVVLLWQSGNPEGALSLEQLWNDLGKARNFSLLCSYPLQDFSRHEDSTPFTSVCSQHSLVISEDTVAV